MAIQRFEVDFETLSPDLLEAWRGIPPAIASDCMNRSGYMAAAIKPVKEGTAMVGQARTVSTMVGDNGISHVATALLGPREVLVIAAGGYEDVAVWGEVATRAALKRGAVGVVIDGAIRDRAAIRALGFPCYARNAIPGGPHKGFGGFIDDTIACAGCRVSPGDIVLGDDDGVVVVPLAGQAEILTACRAKLEQEVVWLAAIEAGRAMAEILGLPEAEVIDR